MHCSPGLANFAQRGIRIVDAFPWNVRAGNSKPTDFYHGSHAMFQAEGFETIATHEDITVVRKIM